MFQREIIVVVCLFAGNLNCLEQHANSNNLYDYDWQCDTVCVGSGGNAEYDRKNHICKCRMDESVLDGIDIETMIKNAKIMGLLLEHTEDPEVAIRKRSIDSTSDNILGERPTGTRTHQSPSFSSFTTRRPILTTRRAASRTTRRTTTTSRKSLITRASSRRQSVTSNISEDARKRIEEIQKRVNLRIQNRARASSLPHLQQRANFDDNNRSNILEQIRERQKELIERLRSRSSTDTKTAGNNTNHGSTRIRPQIPTVGQETPNTPEKPKTNKDDSTNSDIITQPPNLYSKDDD